MLEALKILTSNRVKWADIYPPSSPSYCAAFPSVCSVHIGANLPCLPRLQQLHWQYEEQCRSTQSVLEPEKAFSPRRTEVTGGKIPLEQRHQANMNSPWFCLLQDFQNLFGTHWPNFAMVEVGFVFSPLGQRGQWQVGTKFIEVLSRLEVHGNFSDFHWSFFMILFFLMRNSGFSKKALQGQFTNYC